ncbi:ATP synthase F1 subunit delta [Robertkochia solimangrovi]|uniref:ATP synthase F1 subunit delta n=1 Tax=Robertkochia solimangrovi TaxID=2213046 RepID=UPI0011810DF4|nr:ATP synthase F1 subunit delta [Robertkochia solimangrovi]TRZ46004.1 ATP synthase F1 subunit delta [Robertkochia solimangrovi]
MIGSRAASRYAKAVLEFAKEQNVLDAVHKDMTVIVSKMNDNKDLQLFIENPIVKTGLKKSAIENVYGGFSDTTERLLVLLMDNDRLSLIGEVAEKFLIRYDELMGNQKAVVTTAVPITPELEKRVLDKVTELTGKNVTLVNRVDESIIGGFILRVGDLQYNASIASKLNNLKRDFVNKTRVA